MRRLRIRQGPRRPPFGIPQYISGRWPERYQTSWPESEDWFLLVHKSRPHPCWEDIRIKPCGVPKFLRGWESTYDARGDESLVDLMEGFIQSCQAQKIPVPRPFYRAKHEMEAEDGGFATLGDDRPEIDYRISSGGPKYSDYVAEDDFPTHPVPGCKQAALKLLVIAKKNPKALLVA